MGVFDQMHAALTHALGQLGAETPTTFSAMGAGAPAAISDIPAWWSGSEEALKVLPMEMASASQQVAMVLMQRSALAALVTAGREPRMGDRLSVVAAGPWLGTWIVLRTEADEVSYHLAVQRSAVAGSGGAGSRLTGGG